MAIWHTIDRRIVYCPEFAVFDFGNGDEAATNRWLQMALIRILRRNDEIPCRRDHFVSGFEDFGRDHPIVAEEVRVYLTSEAFSTISDWGLYATKLGRRVRIFVTG